MAINSVQTKVGHILTLLVEVVDNFGPSLEPSVNHNRQEGKGSSAVEHFYSGVCILQDAVGGGVGHGAVGGRMEELRAPSRALTRPARIERVRLT